MKLAALLPLALFGAALTLAACGDKKTDAACDARVATLTAHLATPRSIADIRKTAGPALAADMDAIDAAGESGRAVTVAHALQKAVAGCPSAIKVFGDVAAVEGNKEDFIRARFPASLVACSCKASPEHAGALVESLFSEWGKPRP